MEAKKWHLTKQKLLSRFLSNDPGCRSKIRCDGRAEETDLIENVHILSHERRADADCPSFFVNGKGSMTPLHSTLI